MGLRGTPRHASPAAQDARRPKPTDSQTQRIMAKGTESRDDSRSWYRFSREDVLGRLQAGAEGLSPEEAARRRAEVGPNSIRTEQGVSAWKVLIDQFTSPMIYVLIAALVVTLVIQSWGDATVIAMVLVINAVIGFIQEYRAESAVQSLMKMVSPKATVRRDGGVREVEGKELVPGDIVLLEQGAMVPADVRVLDSHSMQVNESALTGESVPVSKLEVPLSDAGENLPPADQANMAFMGTAVTAGRGEGVVVATGTRTQLGAIAEEIREAGETVTPLQRRMDHLAKWIAAVILAIAAVAFLVGFMMGRSTTQMFLLAVSLSVAAIPAGLPVVMTVALAVGVRRMARRHAVIRNLPAVETLGSCTAIVSDKTGTLTQNRMTAERIVAGARTFEVSGPARSIAGNVHAGQDDEPPVVDPQTEPALFWTLLCGLLNNAADLGDDGDDGEAPEASDDGAARASGDPMEVALLLAALKSGLSRTELSTRYRQIDEIPFQTEQRFSATIHRADGDGSPQPIVLIKGAPERIVEMSDSMMAADGSEQPLDRDGIDAWNSQLASEGLRVLAMAIGHGDEAARSIHSETPTGMTLVGLVGLRDPARPEAIDAVENCHEAGIRVIMVTGDHARTAAAIAQQVRLDRPATRGGDRIRELAETGDSSATKIGGGEQNAAGDDRFAEDDTAPRLEAHTGRQIAEDSDEELDAALSRTNVFARVKPADKVRIVDRLKANRQIVAVTGDGVNDAPALKSAHLGAAMGQTGTDVAKEASDMVITDDNFASVYSAVEEGRTAFRNIRMATFFLLSTGAADVLIILASLALRWPLPLLPAQILWCNVVTNGIADVALGFEPGERSLFRRSPRPVDEGVLDRTLIERLAVVAVWLAAGTLGIFYWVYSGDGNLDLARVSALTTLVLFQKVHVFNCRSEDVSIFRKNLLSNKVLFVGVLASLVVHIAALYIPWTQTLLHFEPLSGRIWIAAIAVAATAIIVNELHKWLRPRPDARR